MAMQPVAIVVILLGLASAVPAWSQTETAGVPRGACLSSADSRDLFVADKLVQPFGVMRDAARTSQAEAIDIQLCRDGGVLVYDVTLLDRQGRVVHRRVDAMTGAAMANPPPRPAAGQAPRPAWSAPRPLPNLYPAPAFGPGPNGLFGPRFRPYGMFGPRFRPNIFQGPRFGPYFSPGPRWGGPFFQGARPGGRGPGAME